MAFEEQPRPLPKPLAQGHHHFPAAIELRLSALSRPLKTAAKARQKFSFVLM
jgi:hypothetical protein